MAPTLPAESTYSDTELDWIGNEPAGRFPLDQSSYWGQARKVFADYLQANIVDRLDSFEMARQIATCPADEIHNWEIMLGLPVRESAPLPFRRALVKMRAYRGPFTRTQRANVVEGFIGLTFGAELEFTPSGIPFPSADAGMEFHVAPASLTTLYDVVEDVPNFTYNVKLDVSLDGNIDEASLIRELERLTTAPITFTITYDL